MTAFSFVVLSTPVEGREDEYNDWYTNRHLVDVLRIPGIILARRYKVKPGQKSSQPYLALCDVETNDVDEVFGELMKQSGTDKMPISDAMKNPDMTIFEAITPLVHEQR